ncbi:DUF6308 family protein [Arthrobacter sp. NPDC092385]|uniref:DUF6308 family protein n=1 Tax=Arthrobacter sp. NPDC092385 TaxID=3363943 RepID=UPI0038309A59
MTDRTFTVAGTTYSVTEAFARLKGYPWKTPLAFDLQGTGEPGVLTTDEVMRTRKVSSRMSYAQAARFVDAAATAPWVDAAADLADANPQEAGGLFSDMTDLYSHFAKRTSPDVSIAKLSKVLYLKHPALYPILDTHLLKAYKPQTRGLRTTYRDFEAHQRAWVVIREELLEVRTTGAIDELRQRLRDFDSSEDDEVARVHRLDKLTDLRLLDILVW